MLAPLGLILAAGPSMAETKSGFDPDNVGLMIILRPESEAGENELCSGLEEAAFAVVRREGENRPAVASLSMHRPRGKAMDATLPVDARELTLSRDGLQGELSFRLPSGGESGGGSFTVALDVKRIGHAFEGSFAARSEEGELTCRGRASGWAQGPEEPLDPVIAWARDLSGDFRRCAFRGPVTDTIVRYNIYLPEEYGREGDVELYPVIYDLHGLNNTETGSQNRLVSRAYEAALEARMVRPAIIVFVNGEINSMYADSADGRKPVETQIMRELLPYVDRVYRTSMQEGARVVQGYSMGGFGAALYATKYPEQFGACVIYDGAMHNADTLAERRSEIWREIYGGERDGFERHSPWSHLEANVEAVRLRVAFRQVVGALVDYNLRFRDALAEAGASNEYMETGLPHDLESILDRLGHDAFAFIERRWEELEAGQGSAGES